MSEKFTGVTFAMQNVTPSDDAIVRRAILPDGILTGCVISYSGSTLTMTPGQLVVCGRQIRNPSAQRWPVVDATSGYARLLLTIDLTRASTMDVFDQVISTVEYASSENGFSALMQEDINGDGTRYQVAVCVVSLGTGGITGVVWRIGISGARPNTWLPTASEIGARPNTWLPTASEIGAAPAGNYAPGGYGLGTEWPEGVDDVNVVKKIGWYITNSYTKNIPSGTGWGYAVLLVERRTQLIYQTLKSADGFVDLRKIERYSRDEGKTWSTWKECFSMGLLWTNASPTSAFAAQTVNLDLSEYDYIEIRGVRGSFLRAKVGESNLLMQLFNSYYICSRTVSVTTSGVTFGTFYKYTSYATGSYTTEDAGGYLTPRYIYGIRGVS